jgi:hypothetical protein
MAIILSARKRCGDQPSSSSKSDRAASQTATTESVARRKDRKLSEMWNFALRWRGVVPGSAIRIETSESVPCGIGSIFRTTWPSVQRQKIPGNGAPVRQFVRCPDRRQRILPKAFCNPADKCQARAFSHPMVASFGA